MEVIETAIDLKFEKSPKFNLGGSFFSQNEAFEPSAQTLNAKEIMKYVCRVNKQSFKKYVVAWNTIKLCLQEIYAKHGDAEIPTLGRFLKDQNDRCVYLPNPDFLEVAKLKLSP